MAGLHSSIPHSFTCLDNLNGLPRAMDESHLLHKRSRSNGNQIWGQSCQFTFAHDQIYVVYLERHDSERSLKLLLLRAGSLEEEESRLEQPN